ncbi:fatty acid desaturase family protein [Allorhodopirellula heiligendammensis]|uniref:Fatty acid desaturase n=1 Tax=Allorhodopirellula heiligendammensis TaxID=2714739 RepID=A0A5C6BGR2_9BACT|nr:fatty acid desaturase [Allorhodopirellula heiligendammensis]TWU11140.1 Fatty acid desaturase [Allorhodopirellula heiligendammensis]
MIPPAIRPEEFSSHGVVLDAGSYHRLHRRSHESATRAAIFVALYIASGWTIWQLQLTFGSKPGEGFSWWALLASLPLYLVCAASLHGISLFTHEAVHGVLSTNRTVNRLLGIVCAWPVLQNYSAYKVLHLQHHKHLGHEGDPDHYNNYSRWSWLVFAMHWVRLLIGYPVYIVMIPILGFRQGKLGDRLWILADVGLLAILIATVCASPLPWSLLLHVWLIPMLLINTMVNIRGMSQHTFLENPVDPIQGTRSILTHPLTEFFMCSENHHLEHHLFPRVPWYHLKGLHVEVRDQLVARQAPFIDSYFAFVREFIGKSWARSPWGRRGKRA